jgi:hypothetical protein
MHVPKTLKDISSPHSAHGSKNKSHRLHFTSFIVSEIKSPQDIKIDRQLQAIFNRLNQSYSTSVNTPHTAFLKQQIDDFLHQSQTVYLYNKRKKTAPRNPSSSVSATSNIEHNQIVDSVLLKEPTINIPIAYPRI